MMDPHQIINLEDGWSDIKTIAIEQLEVTSFPHFFQHEVAQSQYITYFIIENFRRRFKEQNLVLKSRL